MNLRYYPRRELAEQMIQALRGQSLFGDDHNGMFLAAPRRTGKTTFLKSDLKPALEAQGILVVYVDLWADQRREPADLIGMAVSEVMQAYRPQLERLLGKLGNLSIGVGGVFTFGVEKSPEAGQGSLSLPDALRLLNEAADAPLALIIDEAQQALTSQEGEALMVSLKSARDQLNTPDEIRLMLIMSGSDRDKLLRLVNSHSAPFFGSQITSMPLLDRGFVEHLVALVEAQLPQHKPVDVQTLVEAFEAFGHRPQYFMAAMGTALSPLADLRGRFEQAVLEAALEQQAADRADMESLFLGLPPLQQAVLWRLLDRHTRFRPYDNEALGFYRRVLADMGVDENVTAQKVQTALDGVRNRIPSLVWKSARGEYAVEDAAMYRWYQDRLAEGSWPPQGEY